MFVNLDRIRDVKCPVFIIHGKVDEVVPFSHGMKLATLVTNKYDPLWIDYAGHNNIMEVLGHDMYIRRLKKFIQYTKENGPDGASTSPSGNGTTSTTTTTASSTDQ
eukprot:GEZU01007042.1.p1 GENE.GEZU01007042.1~~GEZU01007042.1.p1  ORF type:complete len:106 (+),score=31.61 GEZU01007042.1:332-649(+)